MFGRVPDGGERRGMPLGDTGPTSRPVLDGASELGVRDSKSQVIDLLEDLRRDKLGSLEG